MDAVAVALIAAGGLDGSVLTVRAPLRARGPRALAATLGTSCPGRLAARAALAALLFRHREWLRVRGQNVNRCACLCDRGAAS